MITQPGTANEKESGAWFPETPPAKDWRDGLRRYGTGTIIPNLANAIHALRGAPEWAGVLAFDLFRLQTTARCPAPWQQRAGLQWSDFDDLKAAEWLQHAGINVGADTARQAVSAVAQEQTFHPVREWLRGVEWDSTNRLDDWLSLYCGAEQSEYSRAVGARFLMAAVARILRPGAKVDTVLIMEGRQGTFKSTAAETLFRPYFCDHLPDLHNKDAFLQLRGIWCVELGELSLLGRADTERIKAFLSSSNDRYRPPFGKRAIDVPRETVFMGTTNRDQYFKDETGNRRFWPVRCETIRIRELERDRDQIFAEAAARIDSGGRWWLDTPELNRVAEDEQAARFDADVWQPLIERWLDGRDSATVEEVLSGAIDKPRAQWNQSDKNRVARCLVAAHWERKYVGPRSRREWRYVPVFQS